MADAENLCNWGIHTGERTDIPSFYLTRGSVSDGAYWLNIAASLNNSKYPYRGFDAPAFAKDFINPVKKDPVIYHIGEPLSNCFLVLSDGMNGVTQKLGQFFNLKLLPVLLTKVHQSRSKYQAICAYEAQPSYDGHKAVAALH